MQRCCSIIYSELPVGFSEAHIARGVQAEFTLSPATKLKHKQLCMFGILLCTFLHVFLSFPIPLPLSHRVPRQEMLSSNKQGEKNYLFFFWVVTKRTLLAGDRGTGQQTSEEEGGGGWSLLMVYHCYMWGQKEQKEREEMEGDPCLLQHSKALGRNACLDTTYPDLLSTVLLSERRGQKRTFRAIPMRRLMKFIESWN